MYKIKKVLSLISIVCLLAVFFISTSVTAQYWQAMPPYNLLWPLWVEPLSPGGVPAVTSLDADTVLPVYPSWVWNTDLEYPWFLFDLTPTGAGGLLYFDIFNGFRPFGQSLIPTVTLPLSYQWLVPGWGSLDFATWANQSVIIYDSFITSAGYPSIWSSIVTPGALWGAPPFF